MMIALTFLLIFLVGPLTFWALARQRPDGGYFALLAAVAVALAALARIVTHHAGPGWQAWDYLGLVTLTALWLAWIAVLALCVLALRRRLPAQAAQRAGFALGAMATTLPWFGLQLAQLVAA